MVVSASPSPPALDRVETWVFDLDNTLYPPACQLYIQVEKLMGQFIMDELKLDHAGAHALRKRYFQQWGTTLRGLMNEYGLDPKRFLDYVHEIDLSAVQPDKALDAVLTKLPGRKLIFTNGTKTHAERVLARLGLAHHFDAIHDIVAIEYQPKPEPSGYRQLVERYNVDATRAAMVEDMARNLPPAAALGMATVWLNNGPHPELDAAHAPHIHHTIDNLTEFLSARLTPAKG